MNKAEHRVMRARWLPTVSTGRVPCARCGKLIKVGASWDMGQSDDRKTWTGPEHSACNRATSTHRAAKRLRPTTPHPGLIGD